MMKPARCALFLSSPRKGRAIAYGFSDLMRVEALMLFPDAVQRGAHKGVYAREKYGGGAQWKVSQRARQFSSFAIALP